VAANVTAIKDLQNGMKRVSVEAKVVEKGDPEKSVHVSKTKPTR